MTKLKWTCYYFPSDELGRRQWIGFCTDLDIAIQGDSPEEAQEILREAILSYVLTALELPSKNQVRLLHRRAPVGVRLGLWLKYECDSLRLGVLKTLMRARGDESGQGRVLRSPIETAATAP